MRKEKRQAERPLAVFRQDNFGEKLCYIALSFVWLPSRFSSRRAYRTGVPLRQGNWPVSDFGRAAEACEPLSTRSGELVLESR